MKKRVVIAAAALAALGCPALAQAPGGFPGGVPGGLPPGAAGGFRPMMGGFVMGTIRKVDARQHRIQMSAPGPDAEEGRWITVTPDAVISIQVSGALEDLKPNDIVVVSGVPTTISAAQIQIGELPRMPFGGFGGGFPGGFGGGGFPGPFGGAQPQPFPPGGFGGAPPQPFPPGAPRGFALPAPPGGGAFPQGPAGAVPPAPPNFDAPPPPAPPAVGAAPQPRAFNALPGPADRGPGGMMPGAGNTRVNGTVVSTRPLVVRLPGNAQVTVTADPSTRVTRIIRGKLEDLKVGDTVRMMGQPDAEGNFTANRLDVGMDAMPGFGFGGGFGGGFGFGGPVPNPAQAPRPPGQF